MTENLESKCKVLNEFQISIPLEKPRNHKELTYDISRIFGIYMNYLYFHGAGMQKTYVTLIFSELKENPGLGRYAPKKHYYREGGGLINTVSDLFNYQREYAGKMVILKDKDPQTEVILEVAEIPRSRRDLVFQEFRANKPYLDLTWNPAIKGIPRVLSEEKFSKALVRVDKLGYYLNRAT